MEKNERSLCEAVMQIVEREQGAAREGVRYPEDDGVGPPVDCCFSASGVSYAVEHTIIEPFTGHIRGSVDFGEFVAPIESALDHNMPSPGVYDLTFPIDPCAGRHRRTHAATQLAIIEWVQREAAALYAEEPERRDRHWRPHGYTGVRSAEIDGIAITLKRRVHWASTTGDGRLYVVRSFAGDLEEQRRERVKAALVKKKIKLTESKQLGDLTVLVVETADIALTNHVTVAEALEALAEEWSPYVDRILVADTSIETEWNVWAVAENGEATWDDMARYDFRPADLRQS